MARSYTPGLKILSKANIIKKRLLPLKGSVLFKEGEEVKSHDIVASTKIPGNVQMLNIANQLNVEPEEIPSCMLVKIDEEISKGQIIAENNGFFGFFKSQVKSPINGTLANISEITGQAILAEPQVPIQIDAYTSGQIIKVWEDEGVSIKTQGVLVQGILGIGGENRGKIVVATKNPDELLTVDHLLEEYKNKIIVGGSFFDYTVFKKAKEIGIAGIVTGGMDYFDLSKILGYTLGVAITGSEQIGPSIIITEGFGKISIANRTYELLSKHKDSFASINGSTQIRAGVIRPEILIPFENETKIDDEMNDNKLVISEGSLVRVIRSPFFGKVGIVKSLPHELVKMESETFVRVAEVEFEDKKCKIIPRANLEIIFL